MNKKISITFLVLVLIQGLHSIEEYVGELWNVFPPATWLCSVVSDDLHFGFLVINIGIFIFGLLCWFFLVRTNRNGAKLAIGFWLFIELANGIVHPIWSIMQNSYTPGLLTAPILFVVAVYLLKTLYTKRPHLLKQ